MVKAVISTVILKENKVLLVQEGKLDNYGLWNIPSGRLEDGENIIEGAKREVIEETGFKVEILGLNGIYQYKSTAGNYLINFNFVVDIVEETYRFNKEEILNIKWMNVDDFFKLKLNELWNGIIVKRMVQDAIVKQQYTSEIIKDLR